VLEHYLVETHELGAELSMSTTRMAADAELDALAEAARDTSPQRLDEPYRRALVGVYARLAETARRLGHRVLRPPSTGAEPYADSTAFLDDLDLLDVALCRGNCARIACGVSAACATRFASRSIRAARLRQHSGTRAVFFEIRGAGVARARGIDEAARPSCRSASLRRRAHCARRPHGELVESELQILHRGRGAASARLRARPASSRRRAAPATCSRSPC
jgi:phosphoenolpyruvate carboxylase